MRRGRPGRSHRARPRRPQRAPGALDVPDRRGVRRRLLVRLPRLRARRPRRAHRRPPPSSRGPHETAAPMRAVWLREFGPPSVLTPGEAPEPQGEVVIDVAFANITFVETMVRAGRGPFPVSLPM